MIQNNTYESLQVADVDDDSLTSTSAVVLNENCIRPSMGWPSFDVDMNRSDIR